VDIERGDFETGDYGNSLELVMQSLSGGQPLAKRQIQTETGLTTESLNIALSKLQEIGKIEHKSLGASTYYAAIRSAPPQDWYTIDESASYLRVSRRTIYKLIHDGQLAAYRVGAGGHRRFRKDDLERLMNPEGAEPANAITASDDPVLAELWDNEQDSIYDRI